MNPYGVEVEMKLLLTNDDGIRAKGLRTLAKALATQHELYVVAPAEEQSAKGHALTLHHPLRADDYTEEFHEQGIAVQKAYAISGTPSDCTKLAITTLFPETGLELVLSGINHGPNLGGDVVYSGTVSAALEAAMNQMPAIAISSFNGHEPRSDFHGPARYIADHLHTLVSLLETTECTVLNVNTPAVPMEDYIGLKLCKLGLRMYKDYYEQRTDPRGVTYYWLAGELMDKGTTAEDDVQAIRDNYVTVTPLHADLTDEQTYARLYGNPSM
jgi:5'-nucleotidase